MLKQALKRKALFLFSTVSISAFLLFYWQLQYADQSRLQRDYSRLLKILESARIQAIINNRSFVLFTERGNDIYLLDDINSNGYTDPGESCFGPLRLSSRLITGSEDEQVRVTFKPDGMASGNQMKLVSANGNRMKRLSIMPTGYLITD